MNLLGSEPLADLGSVLGTSLSGLFGGLSRVMPVTERRQAFVAVVVLGPKVVDL